MVPHYDLFREVPSRLEDPQDAYHEGGVLAVAPGEHLGALLALEDHHVLHRLRELEVRPEFVEELMEQEVLIYLIVEDDESNWLTLTVISLGSSDMNLWSSSVFIAKFRSFSQ